MCEYNEKCVKGRIKLPNGKYQNCECFRDRKVAVHYRNADAPEKYFQKYEELGKQWFTTGKGDRFVSLDVFKSLTSSQENVEQMINDGFRIVFNGTTGSGKTQAAISLAIKMMSMFDLNSYNPEINRFYFLSMYEFEENIFNNDYKDRLKRKLEKSKILIIDDLGIEIMQTNNQVPYVLKKLNKILREEFQGLVIITTNMTPEQIKQRYSKLNERLASVLFQGTKEQHGQTTNLFYEVKLPEEKNRRIKKNNGVNYL
ncbi:ATP-binding protein [Priestia megaterium]